ncbi:MAG: hypothetical protein M0Z40_08020, partial [Actinomycetota bacterium]|nr:hypothetical protein [Actinomycetota bacterium]
AVAIAGVARALGVADWYAYPVPTVPSVAPLALAPAVLIAALGAVLPPEAQRDVAGATAARSGAR